MRSIARILLPALLAGVITGTAYAQPNMEEMIKQAQPGPAHERLKAMAGNWKYTLLSMMDPSGKPQKSTGTSTATMILGNRFLKAETLGKMMGKDFSTMSILGYDNRKGKYFVFEIDELGTYSVWAEGDYDEATKTIVLKGTEEENGMKMEFRFLYHQIDNNHRTFTIYFTMPDGSEQKMIAMDFTR